MEAASHQTRPQKMRPARVCGCGRTPLKVRPGTPPRYGQPPTGLAAWGPAALRVQRLSAPLRVAAGALLVALLLLWGEGLPALPGHQDVGPDAAGAAGGASGAAYLSLASSHSRYSSIRCESLMTSSPCTSTGTHVWPVNSSTSGRSRFRNGTLTSSKSISMTRIRRATLPHRHTRSVGALQR